MSRQTREVKIIKCDMSECGRESGVGVENTTFRVIRIRGFDWDLCSYCYEKVLPTLGFLNITVGMPFKFKVVTQ